MRLTNTYTRLAFDDFSDIGGAEELHKQIAQEFHELMAKVERLGDLLGLTPEEVFQEIQDDFFGHNGGGNVASTRSTNGRMRSAAIPMRMDAGELREHLAHELYQWKIGGYKSPDAARSFRVKLKQLARLIGRPAEEVRQQLQEDADRMEDEEDFDHERFSAKGKAVNPWAVCHSQLGPEKNDKFERCVQDVKSKHKIKKD